MRPLYHIAIEGVIGVGKTSLAERLGERLSAKLIREEFDENPFLENFYKDKKRYAFHTQLFFLLSRYRQQQELRQTDLFANLLITDYMFQKDRLFAYLNLEEKELALYNNIANLLEANITNPDLVIYLQADTDRLLYNIRKRGREIEAPITRDYIEALNKMYNEFFFHYNSSPLLIINATEIDFVENPDDLEELIKTIRQPITGTRFLNPIRH
ncbi:MAG: deoxynucleoside kinase [Candidatus Marinimicrobia bacterium]|nr:deoxynucleoside kinase [Candidatus Neomarinimicrobiota bacterium]MCF7839542.1 deoxynucleoside kinase [Candidatus Neomarinimicrobiota bacterium]MCF7901913.1 deoxynucleoside kinase [Candidatus Neomarinimicrobiota bacterium]